MPVEVLCSESPLSTWESVVYDIETNGLLPTLTTIHCVWLCDTATGELQGYRGDSIREALDILKTAKVIIGHNIIGFDIPAIQKIYPGWKPLGRVVDTMILSRLSFPDMDDSDYEYVTGEKDLWEDLKEKRLIGSHSLKSWGYRLGFLKGDYGDTTDWSQWTPEMDAYCKRDVELTYLLWMHLCAQEIAERAADVEHRVAQIILRQQQHGWLFDRDAAWKLYAVLSEEREALLTRLQQIFPPWLAPDGKVFTPKVNSKRYGYTKGCPFQKLKWITFNPNSRQQVAYWLHRRHKWQPTEYTAPSKSFPQGQPKIDEEVLEGLPYPEAKIISRYMMVEDRISQLATGKTAWLKLCKADGRLYGSVLTVGCVTRRMSHSKPNLAQVPRVGNPYGAECRALFVVPPGKVLVGTDAAGLEARVQAHYQFPYDKGGFMDVILRGRKEDKTSIHYVNMRAAGIDTGDEKQDYDDAKTWYYALIYGAGDAKLGRILLKVNNPDSCRMRGRKSRASFEANQQGYARMKEAVCNAARSRGYLYAIDGHRLKVRSEHSALNALFQSAGAIIMKNALVILDDSLQAAGLKPGVDYEFVGNIHDEVQMEVTEGLEDLVGLMCVMAIREAGVVLGCKCPLDGEYKTGKNWKETH